MSGTLPLVPFWPTWVKEKRIAVCFHFRYHNIEDNIKHYLFFPESHPFCKGDFFNYPNFELSSPFGKGVTKLIAIWTIKQNK